MKIGLLLISNNSEYHQFINPLLESARKYFFNGGFDALLWTDSKETFDVKNTFSIDPMPRPLPTLLRYHLFLDQEKELKKYDYLFFCDIDMKFVASIGNEILGEGITATLHPGYVFRQNYYPPYEPNPYSAAYIKSPRQYFCGGFQGGKTEAFIKAMKEMKKMIDTDFTLGYRAIWSDESHYNRYLYDNPPAKVLSPSYCYPDSLVDEFYSKIWPEKYEPKLIALTKKFDLTKQGGDAIKKLIHEV